jgi:hypothetical protein
MVRPEWHLKLLDIKFNVRVSMLKLGVCPLSHTENCVFHPPRLVLIKFQYLSIKQNSNCAEHAVGMALSFNDTGRPNCRVTSKEQEEWLAWSCLVERRERALYMPFTLCIKLEL